MRKHLKTIIFLLTATAFHAFSVDNDMERFFAGPRSGDIRLPADQVYPQGRLFPFSFYSTGGGSVTRRGVLLPEAERLADQDKILKGGVTLVGPQYELNDISLKEASRYGFKLIYSICPEIDGKAVNRQFFLELAKNRQTFCEDKMSRAIAEKVRNAASCKEIAWWDITPEELRYWMPEEIRYLKLAKKVIQENDPLKRPAFMYEPGHRDAAALAKLLPYQDLCIKGSYLNYSGMKKRRVWARYSMEQQMEAICLAGLPQIVPIALPEMFQQPETGDRKRIPLWVRHDVYAMLVAGAKGVLVFSASKRPDFTAREEYLNAYLEVCRELTGPLNLGQVFLFGRSCRDLELTVLEGPKEIVLKNRTLQKTYPSVAMANLSYDGSRYVILVNSSEQPVKVIVSGLVYGSGVTVKSLLDHAEEFTAPEGDFDVELGGLEVVVLKIFNQLKK